jgi:hypothetical protein
MVDVVCLRQPAVDVELTGGSAVEADPGSEGQKWANH